MGRKAFKWDNGVQGVGRGMKTQVDIITGFLGSGKTAVINKFLENEEIQSRRTFIIQCEMGETAIDGSLLQGKAIDTGCVTRGNNIDVKYILEIIKTCQPERIIIEHNGTGSLEQLLEVFQHRSIHKYCIVNKIIHMIDADTFELFMNNMGGILTEQIFNSDFIIINNSRDLEKSRLKHMEKVLKAINKSAVIINNSGGVELAAQEGIFSAGAEKTNKPLETITMIFLAFAAVYLAFIALRTAGTGPLNIDLARLQILNTVFLSILIQAFPFILIGVLVSSIIQVIIPGEKLVSLFPRKTGLGFIAAILAGFLFPVCDCAIVPVAARLVKKGVPLHTAVTFMLAAPLVNPLSIASTLYAFPGQPSIAVYRVFLGVAVALAVGVTFWFFPEERKITIDGYTDYSCRCGYCMDNTAITGPKGKVEAVFRHAGAEFFQVGRFLIIGALLSSMVQVMVPKNIFSDIGGGYVVSLLIMMLAAFVLSVCSTSDAFIGRTFINQFPMGAVMGFMVLGPMLDIKNFLVLLGNFSKRFVFKLVFVLFVLAFIILLFLTTVITVIL